MLMQTRTCMHAYVHTVHNPSCIHVCLDAVFPVRVYIHVEYLCSCSLECSFSFCTIVSCC